MKVISSKMVLIGGAIVMVCVGMFIGGYVFRNTEPRSILALNQCQDTCFTTKDALGILTSIGIQNMPSLIPDITEETDKTIVIKHPFPESRIHYLIIPKRDIKDIGSISNGDEPYISDAFKVIASIIQEQHLTKYRVVTNGPGYQQATYLHFHLLAE